jgi:hypothetical protein
MTMKFIPFKESTSMSSLITENQDSPTPECCWLLGWIGLMFSCSVAKKMAPNAILLALYSRLRSVPLLQKVKKSDDDIMDINDVTCREWS